jgi:hypothetical protein
MWGYVHGGMGRVSFILCDIARDLGAVVAAGVPVAAILPGTGVQLGDGTMLHAPVVVSNAGEGWFAARARDPLVEAAWALFVWTAQNVVDADWRMAVPARGGVVHGIPRMLVAV